MVKMVKYNNKRDQFPAELKNNIDKIKHALKIKPATSTK